MRKVRPAERASPRASDGRVSVPHGWPVHSFLRVPFPSVPLAGNRQHLSKFSFAFFADRALSCGDAYNAGARDATHLDCCNHVSRRHDGPRPDRVAIEWSVKRYRRCLRVRSARRTDVSLVIVAIAVGIADHYRIGEWCRGSNKHSVGEFSIALTVAGGNKGHIDAGGEHDGDGSQRSLTHLPASGPLNGWGFGKPERNGRRLA
jgi:hypothetical protein